MNRIKENMKYFSLHYVLNISELINIFFTRNFDCKISFKTTNSSDSFLKNNDKSISDNKLGVYKLNCNDFSIIYVGHSGRFFEEKIK